MRTTVDIPDPIYRQLKIKAAATKTTVQSLLVRGAVLVSHAEPVVERRAQLPFIRSSRKDKIAMTHAQIYEHAGLS